MADTLTEEQKDMKRLDYQVDVVCLEKIVRRGTDLTSDSVFYDGYVNHVDGGFYLGEWGDKRTAKNGLLTSLGDVAEGVENSLVRGLEDLADKRRIADLKVFYESEPKKYKLGGSRGSTDREGSYLIRPLNESEMRELIAKVDARIRKLFPKDF